jgi:hypothetical protein
MLCSLQEYSAGSGRQCRYSSKNSSNCHAGPDPASLYKLPFRNNKNTSDGITIQVALFIIFKMNIFI